MAKSSRQKPLQRTVSTGRASAAASVVGFALTLLAFYPGYLSPDSVWQLQQARDGAFRDWHPPVMSWIWGVFDRRVPGPGGMLVFHSLMLWSGFALWTRRFANRSRTAFAVTLALGLFPSVFALLGPIWKDVGMSAALMLAAGLLLQENRWAWSLSLVPLFYAACVRHNALAAILPLLVWLSWNLFRPALRIREWAKPGAAAIGAFAALVLCAQAANLSLREGGSLFPFQNILTHDLVAIGLAKGELLVPDYQRQALSPDQPSEHLRKHFSPTLADPLFFWGGGPFQVSADPAQIDSLKKAWSASILSNPGAYLAHRLNVFGALLGIGAEKSCYPYQEGTEPNSLGVVFEPGAFNRATMPILGALKDSLVFKPWIYAILLATSVLVVLRGAVAPGLKAAAFAVGSSALMYEATFFFFAPVCDFRYSWWMTVASLALCAASILSKRASRGK